MTRPRLESDVCDSCVSPWTCHAEPSKHGDGSTSKRESVGPKFVPDKWIRMNNLEVVCMNEIRTFWWIYDLPLRESMEKDYTEVEKSNRHDIDKATMVLCGSVIEGLLYYATRTYWQSANQPDLANIVRMARSKGVISDDEERLCLLMKDRRNLIHPERQLRLGIPPEDLPQRAKAAKAVMEMLILQLEKSSD